MKFEDVKKELAKTYDSLSDYWGNDKSLHTWGEDDLKKFAKLVGKDAKATPAGGQVLDLGCASGYQSKILFDFGLRVTGLDLSPEMIKTAKKRVPEAKFLVGDMTEMSFADGFFEGVYARASILHIPKKFVPKVLKSVHKILKPKGIFYLAVKEGNFEGDVEDKRHGKNVRRFFSFFEEDEIRKLLIDFGFRINNLKTYKRVGGSTTWIKIFATRQV